MVVKDKHLRDARQHRQADRFKQGEDNDEDIVKPDQYTRKLIPNCFGVYKAN